MKYIEELIASDCFTVLNKDFILTRDFKKNGDKLAISLLDGSGHWLASDTIVETVDIFKLDQENNIIAIKPRVKSDDTN